MRSVVTSLQRERGHFFNWYNTQDLKPLGDRFVSTVDSGNLAASLVVVRQACLAIEDQPLIGPRVIDALRDHLRRIREALPVSARTTSIVRLLDGLRRQLEADPDDLFFFEGVLMEVQVLAAELQREAQPAATRVAWRAPDTAAEIRHAIEAFRKRADRMLSDLVQLAPWLGEPFETELRMSLSNPVLANLMHLVRAVPKLAELPHTYHAIEAEIHRLTETEPGLHAATLQMLAVLRTALAEPSKRVRALSNELQSIADWAERTGAEMDFRFLFDTRRNLFRIGWNADTGELAPSSYDLLASEARIGIFLAIARGQAPGQAWFHLGRKLTYYRGHRTLISWSGTMFEYLMPLLFMQTWAGTLLGESMQSVVRIQRMYARERRIPWGISESAHADRDGVLNYQYRAFGVPSCGLDRISPEDLVVAPYASVLALQIDPRAAVENLKYMEARGWRGAFGFYEAIDFRRRSRGHRHAEVIRAFMAHHQGMSLLALTNVLCENAIQKLFHSHPAVLATELLLQERMPVMAEATAPEEQLPTLEALSAEAAPAGGEIVPA
jgi:cyclic beta-1,2-glucan synthetase